jgi:hypothetical protein
MHIINFGAWGKTEHFAIKRSDVLLCKPKLGRCFEEIALRRKIDFATLR